MYMNKIWIIYENKQNIRKVNVQLKIKKKNIKTNTW